VERSARQHRLAVVLILEQEGRLVVPALLDPQVGQSDQRTGLQRALAQGPQPHRRGQRHVGLGPPAGGSKDAAVVGAAIRAHRWQLAPLGNLLADPDPLLGPLDVLGVLTGGEQLAEDLLDDDEVLDLTTGHRCERLVEQQHPFLGAVAVHEAGAEIRHGRER
jgi:hypothetical protein